MIWRIIGTFLSRCQRCSEGTEAVIRTKNVLQHIVAMLCGSATYLQDKCHHGKILPVLAQGRSPEFILQTSKTADRLTMPKTLACCERHVAIDPAKSMRTRAFWEHIPACSSVRIAMGMDAAYRKYKDQAISRMDSLLEEVAADLRQHSAGSAESARRVRDCRTAARIVLSSIELTLCVPPCKAFLEMAEPVPS